MKTDIIKKYNIIKQNRFPDKKDYELSIPTQILLLLEAKGFFTKDEIDDIAEDSNNQYKEFINQYK